MTKFNQFFLIQRTCSRKSGNAKEQGSHPLESYRNLPAYVLLGDPGAGKTMAFLQEAEESGGKYIKARDFATFDPNENDKDKILFIDALDEMRVDGSDGKTPLDLIRKHLEKIGNPLFRLSCREADWLGESDKTALMRVSPNGEITALHLDPLTDNDIIEILNHKTSISDPAEFIRKASEFRLEELLRNPQILNLLVEAVGENKWPKSRKEIYEMACRQLVCEKNREHRATKHNKAPLFDKLLDASGYLCAICLLSGNTGFALDEDATDNQHFDWREIATDNLPFLEALKTNLFKSEIEDQRIPIHRTIAEYLGARYLSALINDNSLPLGRILALVTGEDGGIITDLRGLMAWMSVLCWTARPELVRKDALGAVLYGDVRNFSVEDKKLVLAALKNEAQRYTWFRSDDWSSTPFGALGTMDMLPTFSEILSSTSRDEADQALLDCVLDAIRYGEPMPALSDSLEKIIRDTSYWPRIRNNAVRAYLQVLPAGNPKSLILLDDFSQGKIEDKEDEILGNLLLKLYPDFISPERIFDYIHTPKNDHLIGNYFSFWHHKLPTLTIDENLPNLLDQLVLKHKDLGKMLREYQLKTMVGELLTRGLAIYGDKITNEQLYNWLGAGLDDNEFSSILDNQHVKCITNWFKERPHRYKAVIEYGAFLCTNKTDIRYRMGHCTARLYRSLPPVGIEYWYLDKAEKAKQNEFAEYYFQQAIHILIREGKEEYLTYPKLEFIESWVRTHPNFQQWLEPFLTCPIDHWQRKQYFWEEKYKAELLKTKKERVGNYRQQLIAIREGCAHPKIFHDLALAYDDLLCEAQGETPHERLISFFDGDHELIEATYSGFGHILYRRDLPSVNEIIDLDLKGKERVNEVYQLTDNDLYFDVAKIALTKLLENFPIRARKPQLRNILRPLLKGATYYLDKEILLSIVARKSAYTNMDTTQQVYWLACGLAIAPFIYTEKLQQCLITSKVRRRALAEFLYSDCNRGFPYTTLPEATLSMLIEFLAPECASERPEREGWVTFEMHIADVVRSFINSYSSNLNETAVHELERLLALPNLSHWHNSLKQALHTQRITRRRATIRRLSVNEIKYTLDNLHPANAADLSALIYDHLCAIAKKIRDSNTNDYKLYWNYNVKYKKLIDTKSKPEDDCRDVLLSNLRERLGRLGIDAQREGSYADDKRADIRVSFGGADGFNIPIEIKKDSHKNLWDAIQTQLIPKYTRDPGTEGHGIYLVFWFGGEEMKSSSEGKKLYSASELENILRQSLTPEENQKIQILVIDCALPSS